MSLGQKIGQVMMAGVEGSALTPEGCALLGEVMPGGIFYQAGGNVETPDQLRRFGGQIWKCLQPVTPIAPFFAIDHEGQYIYRFLQGGVTEFPPALALAASGDPELAGRVAQVAGQELAYSGINMIFGPVADVLTSPDSRILAVRTYGGSPQLVSSYVDAAVRGYLKAGLIPVLKHFPGHGGVGEDSHEVLPQDFADLGRWQAEYLPPFRTGLQAGAPALMVGHIAFPNISGDELPATLSPTLLELGRAEMPDGVLISDAMDMKALSGAASSMPQAVVEALKAGIDLVLINRPGQVKEVYNGLVQAVQSGELPIERLDEAVRRILVLKAQHGILSQPFIPASQPNLDANAQLDLEAGRRAITVYRDQADLVPLPAERRRVLVVGPTPSWPFYQQLLGRLSERGFQATLISFPLEETERTQDEQDFPKTLPGGLSPAGTQPYDLMIIFTWQSHHNRVVFGDDYQNSLVNGLLSRGVPAMVIALRSPTDLLDFPEAAASLATFGHTRGIQEGLLRVLFGEQEAGGINPLPWLDIP